jgi:hypothetical protein
VVLQDRSGRLLDLEEQRILLITPLEQHDVCAGSDATDPYDLARHVDDLEPFQQTGGLGGTPTPLDARIEMGPICRALVANA